MKPLRVLSLSTLFPSPARPAFGAFVAAQMDAVAARGDVALTMINPIGIPIWPVRRLGAFGALAACPRISAREAFTVRHPCFRLWPLLGGDTNPRRIARAVLPLARRLHAEQQFDLVDAQFFFPDGPAAAEIARALGLPLTIKARGSDIHLWGARTRAVGQMRAAAGQAAAMLAVSAALRDDMVALGLPAERIAVHHTGLDRVRFTPRCRVSARQELSGAIGSSVPLEGPLLVTPAALIPLKGQRLAIAALAQLQRAHLVLAGRGRDEAALRALARELGLAERVHFPGQVSHQALPILLAAANVVVMPSEREGLANAWIEALACGTPLVIPDVGGAREVVTGSSAGRIVSRDPAAIAAAVRELLTEPLEPAVVAANAARFSWDANAAALVDCWRKAAVAT